MKDRVSREPYNPEEGRKERDDEWEKEQKAKDGYKDDPDDDL